MEIRYFTGYLRDLAQKGQRGDLAHAARSVIPYVRRTADVANTLRVRIRADLAQNRIVKSRHDLLLGMLDALVAAWTNTDPIVDVRDARDWRACGDGRRRIAHHEVAMEDDPGAFGITAPAFE